jgi:ribose/xylose/arabinose/galactoside ABC-type transport system permease subunit
VWKRSIPFLALIVLVAFFSIAAPDRFATASNAQFILVQSVAVAVAAFGVTLVVVSGSIDLSVGSVLALSGVVGTTASVSFGPWVGILAALVTGVIAGFINGVGLAILKVPSFIMTLGMLSIARGMTLVVSQTSPIPTPAEWDWAGSEPGIYLIAIAAFVFCGVLYRFTSFGRYVAAVGGQERVADMSGVPVARIKILVFVLAGAMAAVASIIVSARLGSATPTAGTGFELTVIAAVVLGGTPLTGGLGSLLNTVVGALIINILLNGLVILGVNPEMQIIAQGIVLVLAVLISLDRKKIGVIK